jgi:hypothetical protein
MTVSPRGVGSIASSLAPSDSASQQQANQDLDKLIEDVLASPKAPLMRPHFLPKSVLWDYEDCSEDTLEGVILTDINKSRPRMKLALRHPDGTKIPNKVYENIRQSADIITQKLANLIKSDPRSAVYPDTFLPRTKTAIRNFFKVKYDQALLDIEAEHNLLRLCSYHWKADHMLIQALHRRVEAERATKNRTSANPEPKEPSTASLPRAVAPMNAAKRALELSPGPKSPSASHAQKRSKETAVSGQKTMGSSNRKYLTRCA